MGSITETLTVTGECAYANDYVRLKVLTEDSVRDN